MECKSYNFQNLHHQSILRIRVATMVRFPNFTNILYETIFIHCIIIYIYFILVILT